MVGSFDNKRKISCEEALEIMMEEIDNEDTEYLEMPNTPSIQPP